jgi:tripartite-type tricarboxylate transporter receptor subunit TctC
MLTQGRIVHLYRAAILCLAVSVAFVSAYAHPTGSTTPITLLVGYPSGGLADRLAHLAAEQLSKELHQAVIVKNISGANGVRVVRAALGQSKNEPTIFFADTSLLVSHLVSTELVPSIEDFPAVGSIGHTAFVIAVSEKSKWFKFEDLTRSLRLKNHQYSYGVPGALSVHWLMTEQWLSQGELTAQAIPYRGGVSMLSDLIEQRIAFGVLSTSLAIEQSKGRNLRILAVTAPKRIDQLPTVPAIAEFYPSQSGSANAYLMAAPQIDMNLLERIRKAWHSISLDSEFKQQLVSLQMTPEVLSHNDVEQRLRAEMSKWASVLKLTERKKNLVPPP